MQSSHGAIVLLLVAATWTGVASAGESAHGAHGHDALEKTLRDVTQKNLTAYDGKDAAATMDYVHTQSPEYQQTKDALKGQFENLGARSELVEFHFIGHDDEFAVARYRMKTVAPDTPGFQGNVIDALAVFHQESGVWKLWSDQILGVEVLP